MRIISFEGMEGSGKSTQLNRLADYLKSIGNKVVVSREPGGCVISEKIREILLDRRNTKLTAKTELLLYIASRAQHYEELIKPLKNENGFLLLDRYTDSSLAYQGYGRGLSLEAIKTLNDFAIDGQYPEITFIFEISYDTLIDRIKKRNQGFDRLEQEAREFHERIKNGYRELVSTSDRYVLLNGEKSEDDLAKSMIEKMKDIL